MAWTLCTSGSAKAKAGTNRSTAITGTEYDAFSTEAEGFICRQTNFNWITAYSGLSAAMQAAVQDTCSSLIAMDIISFDPTGYLTREADMLMNKNEDRVVRGIKELKDFKDTLRS